MQQPPTEYVNGPAPIIDIPGPSSPQPLPADKGMASDEQAAFAAGNLDREAAANRHTRDERFKEHLSRARIGIFWILVGSFVGMLLALVIHWITPWCFLSTAQLDTIKTIIGTALASKIFADQAKHL